MGIQAIALRQLGRGGSSDERVKPLIGAQRVQVPPGQRRSGQAGSESCHSPGDWWVRSVDSKEVGREDSAPKALLVADADAVSLAEGRILLTDSARVAGAAGVPSPGHASTRAPQERRRARHLLHTAGAAHPTPTCQASEGRDAPFEERTRIPWRYRPARATGAVREGWMSSLMTP